MTQKTWYWTGIAVQVVVGCGFLWFWCWVGWHFLKTIAQF